MTYHDSQCTCFLDKQTPLAHQGRNQHTAQTYRSNQPKIKIRLHIKKYRKIKVQQENDKHTQNCHKKQKGVCQCDVCQTHQYGCLQHSQQSSILVLCRKQIFECCGEQ